MSYELAKKIVEAEAWDALADAIEREDKEAAQRALLNLRIVLNWRPEV
jgi:hypothetical protein